MPKRLMKGTRVLGTVGPDAIEVYGHVYGTEPHVYLVVMDVAEQRHDRAPYMARQSYNEDRQILNVPVGSVERCDDAHHVNPLQALNSARQVFRETIGQTVTRSHALTVGQALCQMLRGMGMPMMAETLAAEVTELTQ